MTEHTDDPILTTRGTRRGAARVVPLAVAAALGSGALHAPAAAAEQAGPDEQAKTQPRTAPSTLASPVAVAARIAALPTHPVTAPTAPTYTVKEGDTVGHIAARSGVPAAEIIAANGLDANGFIRAGQSLLLGSGTSAGTSAATASAASHTVVGGDTVGHIAARAGVSVDAVLDANGLTATSVIRPGQVLSVPGAAAATSVAPASTPSAGERYTVASGDTLGHIAVRTGTSIGALFAANTSLDSAGTIKVGQTIALPAEAAPMSNTFAGRTYASSTVAAATANRDTLASRGAPDRDEMQAIVVAAAQAAGVDPALAQAIAFQESGFNMRAVSPANAVGAMQVIPSSGTWAGELLGRRIDLLDPHDNAAAGVAILGSLLRSSPSTDDAIAGYYQGETSVAANGMFADTRRYVANIQTLAARYR